jgi:alpha-beta hydrolase superfamily lysophospholipase
MSTVAVQPQHDTITSGAHHLHRIVVAPPTTPIAHLAILHGYGDHAGRFVHVMQWMAERGNIACHAIDFRGHGRSTGKRGHVSRWEEYLDDLGAFLATEELATHSESSPPLFVLGHSHGALVVAAAAIGGSLPHCRGVIMTAPFLSLKMPVPFLKRMLGHMGSALLPSLPVRSGIGSQMLSQDPAMAADTKADPMCLGIATPRWFTTATAAQAAVRAHAAAFTLPLLMLVAGDDGVADPAVSKEFFENAGSSDKTINTYEGMRHELLRELAREPIFQDILAWINARGSPSTIPQKDF